MRETHSKGTGKWRQAGVPHKGWTCTDVEDLEEPSQICEMCEAAVIRYVHYMEHSEHPPLAVGCICAGHMEEDLVGARQREATIRKQSARRRSWLKRPWRISGRGNEYIRFGDWHVVVFRRREWCARVEDRYSGEVHWIDGCPTERQVKLAAFDVINGQKA